MRHYQEALGGSNYYTWGNTRRILCGNSGMCAGVTPGCGEVMRRAWGSGVSDQSWGFYSDRILPPPFFMSGIAMWNCWVRSWAAEAAGCGSTDYRLRMSKPVIPRNTNIILYGRIPRPTRTEDSVFSAGAKSPCGKCWHQGWRNTAVRSSPSFLFPSWNY